MDNDQPPDRMLTDEEMEFVRSIMALSSGDFLRAALLFDPSADKPSDEMPIKE